MLLKPIYSRVEHSSTLLITNYFSLCLTKKIVQKKLCKKNNSIDNLEILKLYVILPRYFIINKWKYIFGPN